MHFEFLTIVKIRMMTNSILFAAKQVQKMAIGAVAWISNVTFLPFQLSVEPLCFASTTVKRGTEIYI